MGSSGELYSPEDHLVVVEGDAGQLVQIRIFQGGVRRPIRAQLSCFRWVEPIRCLDKSEKGPLLGLKRLQINLLAPIGTAKKYVSELTVHHPLPKIWRSAVPS